MKRRSVLRAAGLLATFGIVEPGCQYLPAIQAGVDTAVAVASSLEATVEAIESFVTSYFTAHPNPAEQAKVEAGLARTKQVIAVLFDVLSTAKDAMALDVQKAIQDAQRAYADLLALTRPLGVTEKGSAAAVASGEAFLVVPPPSQFGGRQ